MLIPFDELFCKKSVLIKREGVPGYLNEIKECLGNLLYLRLSLLFEGVAWMSRSPNPKTLTPNTKALSNISP
jgi:hypothetical protein